MLLMNKKTTTWVAYFINDFITVMRATDKECDAI
jgi:hypothetical protein